MPPIDAGRNTSKAKLPPSLFFRIERRATRLSIKANTYLTILLSNFLLKPVQFRIRSGRARMEKEKRVPIPLSLPVKLRKEATDMARDRGGSFTALLEELAERDLAKGGPLVILESNETRNSYF